MKTKTPLGYPHRTGENNGHLTTGEAAALADLYIAHTDILDAVVGRFIQKYGGDREEVRAHADISFVRAYLHHAAGKSPRTFTAEVRLWVWMEAFDNMRTARQYRYATRHHRADVELDTIPNARTNLRFNIVDFMDALSEDARACVRLVLNPPEEVATIARAKGGSEHNTRSTVRQYLRGLGWPAPRVAAAFAEVAGALE